MAWDAVFLGGGVILFSSVVLYQNTVRESEVYQYTYSLLCAAIIGLCHRLNA